MRNLITRRAIAGSAVVLALAELLPATAAPVDKTAVCGACHGHGNCESGVCSDGICAPNPNPCTTAKRPRFLCRNGVHKCCKPSGRKCRTAR